MAVTDFLGARAGSVEPTPYPSSDHLDGRAGPAGAGVAEYDSRAQGSVVRLLRAGALLVIVYQLIFLNLDVRHVSAGSGRVLIFDLAGIVLGAFGFALTYSG